MEEEREWPEEDVLVTAPRRHTLLTENVGAQELLVISAEVKSDAD